MIKDLYARDVLTFFEYEALHSHLADDEYALLANEGTSVSDRHRLRISAFETASRILETEPVKELLEYDLQHVFSYREGFYYIISKLERAVKED